MKEEDFQKLRDFDTIEEGQDFFYNFIQTNEVDIREFKKFINIMVDKRLDADTRSILDTIDEYNAC